MRILYIAPFRDFSGYATAARGYLRALHEAGADIVARPVRYDRADHGTEYQPTELERELLSRPMNDIDIVVQHLTPNEMRLPEAVADKINVAVVAWETTRIPDYWAAKLNQFDLVITFCEASVCAFKDSGVTVPIHMVPHCFDMNSYKRDLEPLNVQGMKSGFMDNRFVFYNISQFSHKKGLDVLIQAYFAEFWDQQDDVMLLLKTYINMGAGRNPSKEREHLVQWLAQIRDAMRLPRIPPVGLITETLSEEKVARLHKLGDCYVCSSRAEGWCIPAFDALAFGNKLVTTRWGGMREFTYHSNSGIKLPHVYDVDFSLEPLVGQAHADPELYTARDKVAEPSVSSMMRAMRAAFEERDDKTTYPQLEDLWRFDHKVVGPQMLRIFEEAANVQPV